MKPDLSVIIPVWEEFDIINETIKNIRIIGTGFDYEIIVIDCMPKGSTIRTIKDKNVRMYTAEKSRAVQMNYGAVKAKGRILVFLHADTHLPRNAFAKIIQTIDLKKIKTGAFNLKINSGKFLLKFIAMIASLRSRITRIPYGDQVIFFESNYFFKIGMYKNIPIMEDIEVMKRVKTLKDKIRIIPDRVITSERRWSKEGIFNCTMRNWLISFMYYLGVKPEKLVKYYY